METLITIIAIGITYVVLLVCIWEDKKQINSLNHQLQGLMIEYKICEAATNGDYKTAGVLRHISRNGIVEESLIPTDKEPEKEPAGPTITQHG